MLDLHLIADQKNSQDEVLTGVTMFGLGCVSFRLKLLRVIFCVSLLHDCLLLLETKTTSIECKGEQNAMPLFHGMRAS